MDNPVLNAIKKRRTAIRFEDTDVNEQELEAILEAGRWAPSWLNKQPWNFIVVRDLETKERLAEAAPTNFTAGLKEAPVCIVVTVDSTEDPFHFVEDGTAAAQNMILASQSLGLQASWIGIFDRKDDKKSAEAQARRILEVPRTHRIIALLPIGHARQDVLPEKTRKELRFIVSREKFGKQ
jgi:nitroreductase